MYEEETYEVILDRMLSRIPQGMDTRESSFLFNASAPVAAEIQNMYLALDNILRITYFDTADREGKYQRCKERGIDTSQFDATYAVSEIHTTPATIDISIGTRFNHGDINFDIIEKISDGAYYARCDTAGTSGNVTGEVVPVDYIDGLESCQITDIYQWGEDEADIEEINDVYYSSLNSHAFGGNRSDYIKKMKAIAGVGGVKVYTAAEWNGGGTCKLVFSTSSYTKPSDSFVDSIQEQIDPLENQGEGYGIAPIGNIVTVVGVDETTVDISAKVTLSEGYTWDDVSTYVSDAIDSYFMSLNSEWDNNKNIIVRLSQIEMRILNVTGIIDVAEITLNGSTSNLTIDKDSIVIRGNVNATT